MRIVVGGVARTVGTMVATASALELRVDINTAAASSRRELKESKQRGYFRVFGECMFKRTNEGRGGYVRAVDRGRIEIDGELKGGHRTVSSHHSEDDAFLVAGVLSDEVLQNRQRQTHDGVHTSSSSRGGHNSSMKYEAPIVVLGGAALKLFRMIESTGNLQG